MPDRNRSVRPQDTRPPARWLRASTGRVSLAVAVLLLAGRAAVASAAGPMSAVAVFPVDNVSGGTVPGAEVRQFFIDTLGSRGIRVLGTDALDDFMTRHRVRYAAGIDAATADALRQETGVQGVLIPSFELADDGAPKVALIVRLVSLQATPTVVWADDAGLAGDDAPGWLELGIVNDYAVLQARALDGLARSLVAYLETGQAAPGRKSAGKFRPKSLFRGRAVEAGKTYSVAVLPFFNVSERRNAGEILALLFLRHLSSHPQFRVVETGVTRQELLNARVIMDGGVSIPDAETVASLVGADFVLAGRVITYEDLAGAGGIPRVEFSVALIEKSTRRVVFSSASDNDGQDGVRFFERGSFKTAHSMATQMVKLTVEAIAGDGR